MTRAQVKKKFQSISKFYQGKKPPISVLMERTGLTKEVVKEMWDEFTAENPTAPVPKKPRAPRKPRVKKPEVPVNYVRVGDDVITTAGVLTTNATAEEWIKPEDIPQKQSLFSQDEIDAMLMDISTAPTEKPPIPFYEQGMPPLTPEPLPPKPSLLSAILTYITTVGYVILILVEMIVSYFSASSTAHILALSLVQGIVGIVIVFMGTALFLKGVNSNNNVEKVVGIAGWLIYVVLFTALNWSWTNGQLDAEWRQAETTLALTEGDRKEYESNLAKSAEVGEKLLKASVWTPPDVIASYKELKAGYDTANIEIRKRLDVGTSHNSFTTFTTMGSLFNVSGATAAKWFYLGLFLLIHFMIVVVVPKQKG